MAVALAAQAQMPIVVGGLTGAIIAENRAVKASEVVTKVTYEGRTFQQRRTPAEKLPQPGSDSVREMEALLQQCYTTCVGDNVTEIISPVQFRNFAELRRQLQAVPFPWSTRFYDEELAFYQQQDHLRRARREQRARQPQPDSLAPARP